MFFVRHTVFPRFTNTVHDTVFLTHAARLESQQESRVQHGDVEIKERRLEECV
jgi:hypothetical protein